MTNASERAYLAANLRRVRRARGLSQDDIAALSGINRAYVSDVEHGKRNVGIDCLGRLAAALQTSAAALLLPGPQAPQDERPGPSTAPARPAS